jgi:N-methylhydantoinase A
VSAEEEYRLMSKYRLGVDVGGTFTDFVLIRDGREIHLHKRLSTPADPSIGVVAGLEEMSEKLGFAIGDVTHLVHGTTVVANALIERKGGRTALVTTEGFRDVLEIGREVRYDIYDLGIEYPPPIVPRDLRFELHERTLADGSVRIAPDAEQVAAVLAKLVEADVGSLAICMINSPANASSEELVAEISRREAPGIHLSLSSRLAPEIREYERMSTTVANAYVHRLVDSYIEKLAEELETRGFGGQFLIMLSHGGVASAAVARAQPIQLVESGPAAGAQATGYIGERIDRAALLAFDMGGTTAKACIVENGQPAHAMETEVARIHRFKKGSGIPLKVPSVDMIEIGAGGGSIARVDHIGLLKVGPDSASASPGPACYGLGGKDPTVTDANLLLGYLDPDSFLGGAMRLEPSLAEEAIADALAPRLGRTPIEIAAGIVALANENMATAARLYMAERGKDPQRFSLAAFGGGGPVHAYRVARTLRIPEIIFPMGAGVLSALGFLVAPPAVRLVRSYVSPLGTLDWDHLRGLVEGMRVEAEAIMAQAGVPPGAAEHALTAEIRYVGQGHELEVPFDGEVLGNRDAGALREAFERSYEELFSMRLSELPVEAMNWRLFSKGPIQGAPLDGWGRDRGGGEARIGERDIYLPDQRGFARVPVYDRYRLERGSTFSGPALIQERESTIVLDGPAQGSVDADSNIIVKL